MKNIFYFLLLFVVFSKAQAFTVGGINYIKIATAPTTVKVGKNPSATGAISIPATVSYAGITYKVTSIGNDSFYNCTGLTSISISNSVTSILEYAFYGCTGLTSVTIPNSVTVMGEAIFFDCTELTSVTISNKVTAIGPYTFRNCSGLTSITIPNLVTSIGTYAFSNCTGLNEVTNMRTTPQVINADVFDGVTIANVNLYVPASSIAVYKTANVWKDFKMVTSLSSKADFNISSKISLYPNPVQDQITITFNDLTNTSVEIIDRDGHSIQKHNMPNDNTNMLSVSGLAKGIYFFKLSSQEGSTIQKVVKN